MRAMSRKTQRQFVLSTAFIRSRSVKPMPSCLRDVSNGRPVGSRQSCPGSGRSDALGIKMRQSQRLRCSPGSRDFIMIL